MEAATPGSAEADTAAGVPDDGQNEVQEALEAMFSKNNLVRDQFLAGNMNPQMYIPISILLAHEKLRNISATEAAVIDAATRSARLGIDDSQQMIRPLLKSKRNVVILRDIPSDATETEVRELLANGPHSELILSIKPDVNNTWFVKFKLDDGTQDVVLWLRSQRFKGQPVNAAIKSEHFLRSFFPLPMAGPQPEYPTPGPPLEYANAPPASSKGGGGVGWADVLPASAPQLSANGVAGKGALPLQAQYGPQLPGFWQPWGARLQLPPLVFASATTLASGSMPVVAQQAAPMGPEILDNLAQPDENMGKWGKGKAKGRWGDEMGGKGKWGEEPGGKGGWGEEPGGKGKWGEEKGGKGRWGEEPGSWGSWSEKGGWGSWGEEKGGKGKGAAQPWTSMTEPTPRRKGHGGREGAVEQGDGGGSGKARWVVRGAQVHGEALTPGPSDSSGPPGTAVYRHDFRKHSRAQFEEACKAIQDEQLASPEALLLLGSEIPIFREVPSVELAVA